MRRPSRDVWAGKSVFLTGHTGFKGAWLLLLLERLGAKVTGFSLPEAVSTPSLFDDARLAALCDDRRGDIRDLAALRAALVAAKPDIVIHMAAQPIVRLSFREPVETFAVNVMGVVHLMEAARGLPGLQAVAVVTSDKCYENRERMRPYAEEDAMGGHDPYSASKGAAEIAAAAMARTFYRDQARACTVRAGNVIGGGDWAADRLIPDLVRAALTGATADIRNPRSVRPWQHVLDPLVGYLLAVEHMLAAERWSGFDAWNFGPNAGEELSVGEVVDVFRKAWDGLPLVELGDPPPGEHEANLLRVDATKAKIQLGWRPGQSNAAAVQAVVGWHRDIAAGSDPRARTYQDIESILGL